MIIDKDFGKLIIGTANADKDAGNLIDALKYMKQASDISLKLSNVTHPTYLLTLRQLAEIHDELGNLNKALEYFELHHKYIEKEYLKSPLNPDPLRVYEMAISYFNLAKQNKTFGNYNTASDFYEKARFLFEELYENKFNGLPLMRYYSTALQELGYFYFQNGIYAVAQKLLEKASKLKENLLLENPNDTACKASLSTIFDKQGDIQLALGDYNKAKDYFKKFLNYTNELLKIEPQSRHYKYNTSVAYTKIGRICREQGYFSMALDSFNNNLEIAKQLSEQSPNSEIYRRNLAISYSDIGEIYKLMGDFSNSTYFFSNENMIFENLYKNSSQNEIIINGLAISYSKLVSNFVEQREYKLALNTALKQLEVNEQLYKENPKWENNKIDLADCYNRIGDIYLYMNKTKNSKLFYAKCESFLKSDNFNSIQIQLAYAKSVIQLGVIALKQKKINIALNQFLIAYDISKDIYKKTGIMKHYEGLLWIEQKLRELKQK